MLIVSSYIQESNSLAAEKASMEAPGISGGDILQLNVGGESFVVTRGTLTQVNDSLMPRGRGQHPWVLVLYISHV